MMTRVATSTTANASMIKSTFNCPITKLIDIGSTVDSSGVGHVSCVPFFTVADVTPRDAERPYSQEIGSSAGIRSKPAPWMVTMVSQLSVVPLGVAPAISRARTCTLGNRMYGVGVTRSSTLSAYFHL